MLKSVCVGWRQALYGIRENHKGYPLRKNIRVFGADTETVHGDPHTFQIVSGSFERIERVTARSIFPVFMSSLKPHLLEKGLNLVWFHNLNFDLRILFSTRLQTLYDQYNDIRLESDSWTVRLFFGRVNAGTLREDLGGYVCKRCGVLPLEATQEAMNEKGEKELWCGNGAHKPLKVRRNLGATVRFLDSAAFCPPGAKSLAAALSIYDVPYKKLPMPEGLGERPLWNDEFTTYALNDARAEEALGLKILELHKDYDVSPCISLPMLAGRILRHHFFKKGESIPFPPEGCREASEFSYHAGKNGLYVKRGVYENVYEYDINSAFPKAMEELPQMVRGRFVKVRRVHPFYCGIYRVRGDCVGPRIPLLFDASFHPLGRDFKGNRLVSTSFDDLWITGYEAALLEGNPDYRVKILEGWVWQPDKRYGHSPIREFVERFWTLKNAAPKGPKRDTYKNILNSLYGKFAACREIREVVLTAVGPEIVNNGQKEFQAGALYNPFVATQITGYVRAKLYRLEKEGEALHSATDSIKSLKVLPCSNDLGGLKLEVYGRCYLFRTKLYLHFAKDASICGHDLKAGWLPVFEKEKNSLRLVGDELQTGYRIGTDGLTLRGKLFDFDGQHLCKYALHGFKGSFWTLYKHRKSLLKTGTLRYRYRHMVGLREGFKRREKVCDFIERNEILRLSKIERPVMSNVE